MIEIIRTETLKAIDSNITTLNRSFKEDAAEISEKMNRIKNHFDQIEIIKNDILKTERRISNFCLRVKKTDIVKYGDDMLCLTSNIKDSIPLKCDGYKISPELWNCDSLNYVNKGILHSTINPDTFNFRGYKGYKWYAAIHVYYDGKIFNKDNIEKEEIRKQSFKEKLETIKRSIDETIISVDIKNNSYSCNFQQYNEFYYLKEKLSKVEFQSNHICDILSLITIIITTKKYFFN